MMSNDDWWSSGVHYDTMGSVTLGERFAARAITQLASDTDGDNIPDSWEIINFGSEIKSDGTSDTDGDGLSDLHEYLAGTVPTNSDSVLMFTEDPLRNGTNEIVLSWAGVTNKTYSILSTTNLLLPWTTNASGIAGTPPINVYTSIEFIL